VQTPSHARSPLARAAEYVPRRPQDTVLHRLVRAHHATFVAHTEATYAAPLPRYVTDAFERYLAVVRAAAAPAAPHAYARREPENSAARALLPVRAGCAGPRAWPSG